MQEGVPLERHDGEEDGTGEYLQGGLEQALGEELRGMLLQIVAQHEILPERRDGVRPGEAFDPVVHPDRQDRPGGVHDQRMDGGDQRGLGPSGDVQGPRDDRDHRVEWHGQGEDHEQPAGVDAVARAEVAVIEQELDDRDRERDQPEGGADIDRQKSFEFITKTAPAAVQILAAAKKKSGSAEPNKQKVGMLTWDQIRTIAEDKMADLNAFKVESAMKMVAGTARSMGINVKGDFPS